MLRPASTRPGGLRPRALGRAALRALAAGLLAAAALVATPTSAAPRISEYELKAEFVERFASFATWPQRALPPAAPVVVCIRGESAIRGPLERLAAGRKIQKRAVVVRTLSATDPVSGCHLLFIPGAAARDLDKTLEAVSGRPILTLGDTRGFGERGVMINMFRAGKFVRFELNRGALEAAGLKLPARVLRLGREVRTR